MRTTDWVGQWRKFDRRVVSPALAVVAETLPGRAFQRFRDIDGQTRALVIGGQAFTTVIPLLIVTAAAASRRGPTAIADKLTARFHVTGTTAESIRTLFERPPGSASAATLTGVAVGVFSLLSLTRTLQRCFEAAWELPAAGVRGTLNGFTGVGLLIASVLVLSLLTGVIGRLPAGTVVAWVLRILTAAAVWLLLERLLLSRRVSYRRLLPGAIVAGLGQAVMSAYSGWWMPRVIQQNANNYGIIGVTFSMLTWLIAVGLCIVIIAVLSAELDRNPRILRAR
jgi:uncharacterized BrkB/YihY/UPF0761 family membrane protein